MMRARGRNLEGTRTGVFARFGFLRTKQLSRARGLGGYYFYLFIFFSRCCYAGAFPPDLETVLLPELGERRYSHTEQQHKFSGGMGGILLMVHSQMS